MNCFCGMVDWQKLFSLISCCEQGLNCAEPEFRLSWIKSCSSDKLLHHDATFKCPVNNILSTTVNMQIFCWSYQKIIFWCPKTLSHSFFFLFIPESDTNFHLADMHLKVQVFIIRKSMKLRPFHTINHLIFKYLCYSIRKRIRYLSFLSKT